MQTRISVVAICSIALLLSVEAVAAEADFPRAWDGHPDFNGIWQAIGTAHWDLEPHGPVAGPPGFGAIGAVPPGQGVVVGGRIPYQDQALEKRAENFANRYTQDPEIKCFLPGVPRFVYLPHPFQVIQGDRKIMLVSGFAAASRTIHMDKDDPESAPIDSWMGRSHGRWDGDTLVVESAGFNGESWFDRAGNFASWNLKVTERFTPLGANAIMYEATMEDDTVFTRPWSIRMPLYRRLESDIRILEFKCVEFAEEILYGHLRRNAEGE